MGAAGVDACILPSAGLGPELGQRFPKRQRPNTPAGFAILGNFPLEKPESRSLIDTWKQRPGMLGLRYAFTQPHQQNWMTDGTMDWLWPAAEKAGSSDRADGIELPISGRADRRAPSRPQADPRSLRPRPRTARTTPRTVIRRRSWRSPNTPMSRSSAPERRAIRARLTPTGTSNKYTQQIVETFGPQRMFLGHRHHPHALLVEAMRHDVHRSDAMAEGPRPRTGDGRCGLRLARLGNCRPNSLPVVPAQAGTHCAVAGMRLINGSRLSRRRLLRMGAILCAASAGLSSPHRCSNSPPDRPDHAVERRGRRQGAVCAYRDYRWCPWLRRRCASSRNS